MDRLISKLKKYNETTLYIDDEVPAGIDIVESIPEALRVEVFRLLLLARLCVSSVR